MLLLLDGVPGSFLQLSEPHLGALGVLLEDSLVGFLPLLQNILETIICLSLGPFNQVADLEALLSQLNHAFVVLGQDLTFSHLKLLQITFLLCSERLLLPGLSVNRLRKDTFLLVQVLQLLGELLMLSHVLFGLLDTDTIVLRDSVKLG